ncbi:MAG: DUF86 domain-containing protein [Bacteroidales bacterium]
MHNKDYFILLSLLETVDKVITYSSSYQNAEAFYENDRDFDASMMNFIIIGESVGKLSKEFKEKYTQIDWDKMYSLRNIIAHHYFGINVDIIWQIIQNDIPQLKANLRELIE